MLLKSLVRETFSGTTPLKKTLYVDVGSLYRNSRSSGTNRVTERVAYELLLADHPTFKVVLVSARHWKSGFFEVEHEIINSSLVLNSKLGSRVSIRRGDIFLGLDLSHISVISQKPYLSKLVESGVIVSFCIYDLLPIQFPHFFTGGRGLSLIHRLWIETTLMSDVVFAISKSVANEYVRFISSEFPTKSHPDVKLMLMGSDIEKQPPELNKSLSFPSLQKNSFFLAVGTVEPRKRYDYILSEFVKLWASGLPERLVIVGKPGWLTDSLQKDILAHQDNHSRVIWLTDATDSDLRWLYQNSKGLIAASDGEGFGLPIVEMASLGGRVIANDIPIFREVAPETALFFDNKTPGSLVGCLRNELKVGARDNSKLEGFPTWKDSASKVLHLLSAAG